MSTPLQSPILEFLGNDAGAGGPFALLGVLHAADESQIVHACNRRLNQINRHPHRSTPDADEVRLAIHTAASQLLDAGLKEELTRRWPEGVPVSVPQAWKPRKSHVSLSPAFIQRARLLIGSSGGWNATARKRLAHFARLNRITALEMINALAPAVSVNKIDKQGGSNTRKLKVLEQVQMIDPPTGKSLSWLAAYGLMIVLAGIVGVTILFTYQDLSSSETQSDSLMVSGSQSNQRNDKNESAGATKLPERDQFKHYTAIAHELDQLAVRIQHEPEQSMVQFGSVYHEFLSSWTDFPDKALKRSSLHIADFVRQAGELNGEADTISSLFACDEFSTNPLKMMIHMGILDIVISDSKLDQGMRDQIVSLRRSCSGYRPQSTQDIHLSVAAVAGLLATDSKTDTLQWWKLWLEGVSAATTQDKDQRTRLILSALSSRLRNTTSRNQEWVDVANLMVNSLSWRADGPERVWLLSQFADEAVTTARLSAITNALAFHSAVPQIDANMVLNPGATFPQRQLLANDYKTAWTSSPADRSSVVDQYTELVDELRLQAAVVPTQMDEQNAANTLIRLARLNSAAWRYSNGDDMRAAELLVDTAKEIGFSASKPSGMATTLRDSDWAQKAINAKSLTELMKLFPQLVQDGGPGGHSAHALGYLATTNSDSEIRSAAVDQLIRYKEHSSVLIAVDRLAASKRVTSRIETLVLGIIENELPDRTDESWYAQAHASLMVMLTNALSTTIETNHIALAEELSILYAERAELREFSQDSSSMALDQITLRYQQLLFDVQRLSSRPSHTRDLEHIETTFAVRLERASGPIQRFFAYQRALCELQAMRVGHDRPGSALQVQDILADLALRVGRSKTAIEQMVQAERCLSQLWILRIEGGRP